MSIKSKDTQRHFGLPISFTNYSLTEDRLFRKSGILTRKEDQVSLYHIRDMEVSVSGGADEMHLDYSLDVSWMMTEIRKDMGNSINIVFSNKRRN